jgi:hypothetical protein
MYVTRKNSNRYSGKRIRQSLAIHKENTIRQTAHFENYENGENDVFDEEKLCMHGGLGHTANALPR